MPGYSYLTRKSSLPSSTTVNMSSDSLRSSNRLKNRCISVIQARSISSPDWSDSGWGAFPAESLSFRRSASYRLSSNSADGLSNLKKKLPNSRRATWWVDTTLNQEKFSSLVWYLSTMSGTKTVEPSVVGDSTESQPMFMSTSSGDEASFTSSPASPRQYISIMDLMRSNSTPDDMASRTASEWADSILK